MQIERPNMPHWNLVSAGKADPAVCGQSAGVKLPLKSFNHVSREVLSLSLSIQFYCNILGFVEIKRPAFEAKGVWLWGYGISIHLIQTQVPEKRRQVLTNRLEHFTSQLPTVDHIAFLTDDLPYIRQVLIDAHVYHKDSSAPGSGIDQIFLFDPDGNVIEVSNCAPPVGEDRCITDAVAADAL
jgi:catechol 2,3-dioxygenase-like lactoylglutathione lyase family enzyme